MSQKFRLVEDKDGRKATIRHYATVVSWLLAPIAAIVILSAICIASAWLNSA